MRFHQRFARATEGFSVRKGGILQRPSGIYRRDRALATGTTFDGYSGTSLDSEKMLGIICFVAGNLPKANQQWSWHPEFGHW